jgi:hypothetical protein
MTKWTDHVRNYSNQHNVTYGEAMQLAKNTYQKQSGGDLKSAVRKTKNTVNRGSKIVRKGARRTANFLDKHSDLLSNLDGDLGRNVSDISQGLRGIEGVSDQAISHTGGRVTAKKVVRKARNTVKRVSRAVDRVAPFVGMINPEAGLALHTANSSVKALTGGCVHCGAVGGSFAATGGSFATTGGKVCLGRSESSILSATHNSFKPLRVRSYRERKHTN